MPQTSLERRIQDLLDLAQNACEFYLLSPATNARAVFILTDDLCELVLKSELEEAAKRRQAVFKRLIYTNNFLVGDAHKTAFGHYVRREIEETQFRASVGADSTARKAELDSYLTQCGGDPQDWTPDIGGGFKKFEDIAEEVKSLRPTETDLHTLLDAVVGRRVTRNRLFHDQNQASLTVTQDRCLDALLALFQLAEHLWGQNFIEAARSNAVVRAQLAALRFKFKMRTHGFLENVYGQSVNRQREPQLNKYTRGYDCLVLQDGATTFYSQLKRACDEGIVECQSKITNIQNKRRPPVDMAAQITHLQEEIAIYQEVLRDCFV